MSTEQTENAAEIVGQQQAPQQQAPPPPQQQQQQQQGYGFFVGPS